MQTIMDATREVVRRLCDAAKEKEARTGNWNTSAFKDDEIDKAILQKQVEESAAFNRMLHYGELLRSDLNEAQLDMLSRFEAEASKMDSYQQEIDARAQRMFVSSLTLPQQEYWDQRNKARAEYRKLQKQISGYLESVNAVLVCDQPAELPARYSGPVSALIRKVSSHIASKGNDRHLVAYFHDEDKKIFFSTILGKTQEHPKPLDLTHLEVLERAVAKGGAVEKDLCNPDYWKRVKGPRGTSYLLDEMAPHYVLNVVNGLGFEYGPDFTFAARVGGTPLVLEKFNSDDPNRAHPILLTPGQLLLSGQVATDILAALGVDKAQIQEMPQRGLG